MYRLANEGVVIVEPLRSGRLRCVQDVIVQKGAGRFADKARCPQDSRIILRISRNMHEGFDQVVLEFGGQQDGHV